MTPRNVVALGIMCCATACAAPAPSQPALDAEPEGPTGESDARPVSCSMAPELRPDTVDPFVKFVAGCGVSELPLAEAQVAVAQKRSDVALIIERLADLLLRHWFFRDGAARTSDWSSAIIPIKIIAALKHPSSAAFAVERIWWALPPDAPTGDILTEREKVEALMSVSVRVLKCAPGNDEALSRIRSEHPSAIVRDAVSAPLRCGLDTAAP